MFVAATFRLRHFRSGNDRSGYHLWFVIVFRNHSTNTKALNLITLKGIAPHPIPLPSGERGG
jgi:hypothetical protein